jgi:phosphatidate cytidylyltransferase
MAFNVQTFRTRTLTAAIFVVIMLAGLLINHWTFFLLFSIIHFGCWTEYQKLVGLIDKEYQHITPFHKYGVMIAGWCIMLYFSNDAYNIFGLRLHELGWWVGLIFVFILPITELLFTRHIQLRNIGYSALGLIYISLSWGLMMDLYQAIDIHIHDTMFVIGGDLIPLLIIISLWINDTMAYIIGSLVGKRPLSSISPKKTWEGTIGGIILSIIVVGLVVYYYSHDDVVGIVAATIALITSLAGTFGDLLESKLKRMAGVKDSGHIMPGHGGFLDRFDSLLLAIPFVWLLIYFFTK